ncbi:MAG: hypothetical protein N2110_08090 [Flavobacteriales bacterium]|nr:hypothetical protein [Flavobacteriales bacterium]
MILHPRDKWQRAGLWLVDLLAAAGIGGVLLEKWGSAEPATLQSLSAGTDDWNRYARHAVEIGGGALLIPSAGCPYAGPGGFLYNYFLGLLAGIGFQDVRVVWAVHAVCLWGAGWLFVRAFGAYVKTPPARLLLSLGLWTCLLADYLPAYSWRLLSENLAVFLEGLWVYLLSFWDRKGYRQGLGSASCLVLGLGALCRPQWLGFLPLFAAMAASGMRGVHKKYFPGFYASLLLMFLLSAGVAVRNTLLCGRGYFLPTEGAQYAQEAMDLTPATLLKKGAFILGYLPALEPAYQIRPHWMLVWILWGWGLVQGRRKILMNTWGKMVMVFIFYYILTLFFVDITSYGYRYVLPIIPMLAGLGFILIEDRRLTQEPNINFI